MSCFFSRLRMNAPPILWGAISFVLLFIASVMCSVVAMAAVVSLQPPPANEALLRIPVILTGEGGEDLAGIQFDLNYDATQYTLESIETGAAASDAGKDAILSQPAPGRGRILITGFNNNTLFDGHVATLILRPRTPDAAAYTLAVENLLATDPLGSSVPIDYADDYAYPPLPPEKIEADLAESTAANTDEGEAESNADSTTADTPLTSPDSSSSENASTQDAVASDYGGALATRLDGPTSPRTAQRTLRQNSSTTAYRTPVFVNSSGVSAPARPRTVAARPASRSARAPIPSRNTRTNASSSMRPTERIAQAEENGEMPLRSAAPAYRRLALVVPTQSPLGPDEGRPGAGVLLDEGVQPSTFHRSYSVAGIAFFLLFFVGFGALHIKVFRWLSGNTWRRHT